MAAYVVAQLASAGTKPGRAARTPLTSGKLKRLIADHEGELVPAPTPEAADSEGSQLATIKVPDMAHANRLAAALRDVDGIETAYAKPGEELP
jgi:hypothetical protein